MKKNLKKVATIAIVMGMLAFVISSAFAQDTTAPRGFLGIGYAPTDEGVRVTEVVADSPAEAAGLQVDDIITSVNDTPVTEENIVDVISGYAAGETIRLNVLRGGETLEVSVTLAEAPIPAIGPRGFRLDNLGIGFELSENGLTITQLSEDHPLYEAGLREGDIITAINGEALSFPGTLPQLRNFRNDENITLTLERDGETLEIEINPQDVMGLPLFQMRPFGDDARQPFGPFNFDFNVPFNRAQLGVRYAMLTAENASDYEASRTEGAYITEVIAGSPAEEAGLMAGDIVIAVNGDIVDAERTLAERIYPYDPGDTITLDVVRGEETLQIEVTLASRIESANLFPEGMFNFDFDGRGFPFGNDNGFFFGPEDIPATPESSGSF